MIRGITYFIAAGLIFLFTSLQIIDQERDKNLVYWDERSLTWDDFKGAPPANTKFVALTHSAIKMVYGGEGTKIQFCIETTFYPNSSWRKPEADDHVLKHEQLHFDITEYHSRLLRKELQGLEFKSEKAIPKVITKRFNKYSKLANKMQDKYDKETNHSIDRKEQKRWNKKMEKLLKSTEDYAGTTFELNVSYLLF